jgi:two-component system response regulator RpfG
MAEAMNLSEDAVAAVENAALLHDIGKLALPEASLFGDSPVGDIEMAALVDYPARTLELLEASAGRFRWRRASLPWPTPSTHCGRGTAAR